MQLLKLVVAQFACLSIIAGHVTASETPSYESKQLELRSLQGCVLHTRWVGFWPRFPEGVMLTCGDTDFLVLQPTNLLGHVHIAKPEDALNYVRLFSSPDTYKYFDMHGMVELVEGDARSPQSPFNVVDPKVFKRYFRRAQALQVDNYPCKAGVVFACGKEFRITRVAVFADQHVYEVVETVYETGFYNLVSKRLLFRDASRIGVLHFGNL